MKTIINDWRHKGIKKLKNIAELLSTVHLVLSYISEESIVGTSSSSSNSNNSISISNDGKERREAGTSTLNHLMTSSDVRLTAVNPMTTTTCTLVLYFLYYYIIIHVISPFLFLKFMNHTHHHTHRPIVHINHTPSLILR